MVAGYVDFPQETFTSFPDLGDSIDSETFGQMLDLDEDDNHNFSR